MDDRQVSAPAFGALGRLVRTRRPEELCELCGERLAEDHRHLLEPPTRQVICACQACAILFSHGQSETRYKTIPRRIRRLEAINLPEGLWEGLGLPVNMAFFQRQGKTGKVVAYFPSPGGATESLLPLDTWEELEATYPELATMEPDVEALLVNRITGGGDFYLVPVDECFRLVGLVRLSWKGISGGTEVWRSLNEFFMGLSGRAQPAPRNASPAGTRGLDGA